MAEEWKPIEQLEGYSVSSYGNIRNDKTGNIRKFVPSKHNRYARLSIGNTAHRKQYAVHRLVAEAFLEKPEGAYEVNHINGNKYDNRVENLEWCTHSENMKHACRTGLCPYPKAPTSPVVQLSPNMQILGIYDSCVEASEATGVPVNTIYCTVCQGNKNPVNGNVWIKLRDMESLTTSENKSESGSDGNE